jgi:hypothetical protein
MQPYAVGYRSKRRIMDARVKPGHDREKGRTELS